MTLSPFHPRADTPLGFAIRPTTAATSDPAAFAIRPARDARPAHLGGRERVGSTITPDAPRRPGKRRQFPRPDGRMHVAIRSFAVSVDGTAETITAGRSFCRGDHPLVTRHPENWRPATENDYPTRRAQPLDETERAIRVKGHRPPDRDFRSTNTEADETIRAGVRQTIPTRPTIR